MAIGILYAFTKLVDTAETLCFCSQGGMKTILRHSRTGLFFAGADCWTADPAKARDFRLIDRALEFIEKWHMRDVRVAFTFRNAKGVVDVPHRRLAVKFSEE